MEEKEDASAAVVMTVSGPIPGGAFRFSPTAGSDDRLLVADDAAPVAASPPPPGQSPWFDMVVEADVMPPNAKGNARTWRRSEILGVFPGLFMYNSGCFSLRVRVAASFGWQACQKMG